MFWFATADNTIGYIVPIITIIRNKIKKRLLNTRKFSLLKNIILFFFSTKSLLKI